jgi:hypothetical protein
MKSILLLFCILLVSCGSALKEVLGGRPHSEKVTEELLQNLSVGDRLNGLFVGDEYSLDEITLETLLGGPGTTENTSTVSFLVDRNCERWITVRYSPKHVLLPREMKEVLKMTDESDAPLLVVREVIGVDR